MLSRLGSSQFFENQQYNNQDLLLYLKLYISRLSLFTYKSRYKCKYI